MTFAIILVTLSIEACLYSAVVCQVRLAPRRRLQS